MMYQRMRNAIGYLSTAISAVVAVANADAAPTNAVAKLDRPSYTISVSGGQTLGPLLINKEVTFDNSPTQPLDDEGSNITSLEVELSKPIGKKSAVGIGLKYGQGSGSWTSDSYGTPDMTGTANFEENVQLIGAYVDAARRATTRSGRLYAEGKVMAGVDLVTSELSGNGSVRSGRYSGVGTRMDSDLSGTLADVAAQIEFGYRPSDLWELFLAGRYNKLFGDMSGSAETDVILNGSHYGMGNGERTVEGSGSFGIMAGIRKLFGKK